MKHLKSLMPIIFLPLIMQLKYKSLKSIFIILPIVFIFSERMFSQKTTIPLKISLIKNTEREQKTKEQLQKLINQYDLSKWMFTDTIVIEDGFTVIPHSHPVLTLSTRHIKDDELLLSTFIHEELHWYLQSKPKESKEVYNELLNLFPNAPTAFPDASGDLESTYYHIIVCCLEYNAIKELLGELKAKQIMDFWVTDHYKWIYKTVLEQYQIINNLMRKHQLIPIK